MTHIVAGNKAPGFSLQDSNGKDYSLSALLEKGPVIAAFFKISCPVCQFTFPFIERIHQRHGKGAATILGISQDDAKATKKFADEYGVTFPMALDESAKNYPASNAYGLTNVPTVFLIEPGGHVKVVGNGFDRKALEEIAASLADRQQIAASLADRQHIAPLTLFRPDERVPDHKPG